MDHERIITVPAVSLSTDESDFRRLILVALDYLASYLLVLVEFGRLARSIIAQVSRSAATCIMTDRQI